MLFCFANINGQAYISVNKALVTQASAAIPVVPLYVSLLYKIMKEKNIHEGCIEQIYRLYQDCLYASRPVPTDSEGRIRLDDLEMRNDVQEAINTQWPKLDQDNLEESTDLEGYRQAFYHLFGFGFDSIDYEQDVDVNVSIPSIEP